jgi:sugar O-acyltransferase (sialic acid O-acetyltransferase NeuD family)
MINYLIYGAGGNGREAMSTLKYELKSKKNSVEYKLFFIETDPQLDQISGIPLVSDNNLSRFSKTNSFYNISISNTSLRSSIAHKLFSYGFQPFSILSSFSNISEMTQMGSGALISPNALISCDTEMGDFVHVNYFASISHDVKIGNFVSVGPGARVNGNTIVKDNVFIGAQAAIREGSKNNPRIIGEGAVIGMGAVVVNDVEPYTTVAGNPAKVISLRNSRQT